MNLHPIFDLAEICHQKGIQHAVISPGSRNAALTIAFARHPKIKCFSVPDERSAAFIALGMSLKTGVPTVLICTSGSAALNYAPAVAEAYFNQVPLLILSADRPPEWIGQRDGQTIYQEGMFGRHVKKSYAYPSLDEAFDPGTSHLMIREAVDICLSKNQGPVHINIPFREPFYPEADSNYSYDVTELSGAPQNEESTAGSNSGNELADFQRVLIVVGQDKKNEPVTKILSDLSANYHIPVIADVISNAHQVTAAITHQDLFLKNYDREELKPDLLITVGKSVISKNLKIYLRTYKPGAHWHVRNEPEAPDTYKALTRHIEVDSLTFLNSLSGQISASKKQTEYYQNWQKLNEQAADLINVHASGSFSDFATYQAVMHALPAICDLHLANSMAVRYANVIGLKNNSRIEVYCNRGTSGIDGSNSTALGAALMTDRPTFLFTGDMAFLYDRNAFWHNHLPDNLCIVVFNNHGGGIFRMIDGPSKQPELETYFETKQKYDAGELARTYGFEYFDCHDMDGLSAALPAFMKPEGRKILEIFTDAEESKTAYKELFAKLAD